MENSINIILRKDCEHDQNFVSIPRSIAQSVGLAGMRNPKEKAVLLRIRHEPEITDNKTFNFLKRVDIPEQRLLIHYKVIEDSICPKRSGIPCCAISSSHFIKSNAQFPAQFFDADIQPVKIPRISEIVFEVKNENDTSILGNMIEKISNGTSIYRYGTVHTITDHEGCSLDFRVGYSYPYRQGVLDKSTVTAIVCNKESFFPSMEYCPPDEFLSWRPPKDFESIRFKVSLLPHSEFQTLLKTQKNVPNYSVFRSIIVPLKTLRMLRAVNGDWVYVGTKRKRILAQIHVLNNDITFLEESTPQTIIHPTLFHYFEFSLERTCSIDVYSKSSKFDIKDRSHRTKKLRLCAYDSPWMIDQKAFFQKEKLEIGTFRKEIVQDYFDKNPQVISTGQVIAIEFDRDRIVESTTEMQKFSISTLLPNAEISLEYFRIQAIEAETPEDDELETLDFTTIAYETEFEISEESESLTNLPPFTSLNSLNVADFFSSTCHQMSKHLKNFESGSIDRNGSILLTEIDQKPVDELIEVVAQRNGLFSYVVDMKQFSGLAANDIINEFAKRCEVVIHSLPCLFHVKNLQFTELKHEGAINEEEVSVLANRNCRLLEKEISEKIDYIGRKSAETGKRFGFIGSCSNLQDLEPNICGIFDKVIELEDITVEDRLKIMGIELQEYVGPDVDLQDVAKKSANLGYFQFSDFLSHCKLISAKLNYYSVPTNDSGVDLSVENIHQCAEIPKMFHHAEIISELQKFQKNHSNGLKYSIGNIPDVKFDDVGGLEDAKREIYSTLMIPLQHEAHSQQRRTGLLFYGPPGCGKTLLAKAVANELQCAFFSIKGPELMNMYVGETEKNIRDLFHQARKSQRAVIFFDELDAMAPRKEGEGVMGRVVSQLLTELDSISGDGIIREAKSTNNMKKKPLVFVIGATNRPDLLDPSLLRPGRFDKMVYLEPPSTFEEQLKLLKACTKKLPLSDYCILEDVARDIPVGRWTGADFHALAIDALMKSVGRTISNLEKAIEFSDGFIKDKSGKGKMKQVVSFEEIRDFIDLDVLEKARRNLNKSEEISPKFFLDNFCKNPESFTKVLILQSDFLHSLKELKPSVSEKDLAHYRNVQSEFQNSC